MSTYPEKLLSICNSCYFLLRAEKELHLWVYDFNASDPAIFKGSVGQLSYLIYFFVMRFAIFTNEHVYDWFNGEIEELTVYLQENKVFILTAWKEKLMKRESSKLYLFLKDVMELVLWLKNYLGTL